jgi:hypothetical protein
VITILGEQLPALLAAHAAKVAGHEFQILTLPDDSRWAEGRPGSGLYMAACPPQLTTEPYLLQKALEGSPAAYNEKAGTMGRVLADLPADSYTRTWAWNPDDVLEELRGMYGSHVRATVYHDWAKGVARVDGATVVNTYPLHLRCKNEDHVFNFEQFWATPYCRYSDTGPNTVVGSGRAEDWWHTCFNLPNGKGTWLPFDRKPNGGEMRLDFSPAGTTCDCFTDELHVGALAAWDADYAVENAYFDTLRVLAQLS